MYEPSRTLTETHIAGFAYYDGVDVFADLKVGTTLELAAQPDNSYDRDAVMVLYKGTHIGFIPRRHNCEISKLLYFGYGEILETKVNRVTPESTPEGQIGIVVKVKDGRFAKIRA
ncbi:MAG: HIRAN domain-containing protein [Coriobacteriia bacterium]|nr:HIRAN domain-containing protein [Coriobacteriia bacterium]